MLVKAKEVANGIYEVVFYPHGVPCLKLYALWLNSLSFLCLVLIYVLVVDERLVRRGELLLSLDFLEGYDAELMDLNNGKVG